MGKTSGFLCGILAACGVALAAETSDARLMTLAYSV